MNKKLKGLIASFAENPLVVSEERKSLLHEIIDTINAHLAEYKELDILVVCTHNSRRSQLGEVWINTLTNYFGLSNIRAYSGGTETTAFNIRMVNALKVSGFQLQEVEQGENPRYISLDSENDEQVMFSKVYYHEMNPSSNFMALMVCDHADENCPVVLGMKYRIPLRYKDPKAYDDTELEAKAYLDKVKEIGAEVYYIMERIK